MLPYVIQFSALVNMGEANAAFRRLVSLRNSLDYGMNYTMENNNGAVRGDQTL